MTNKHPIFNTQKQHEEQNKITRYTARIKYSQVQSPINPAVKTRESSTTEMRALITQGRKHLQDINTQNSMNLLPDTQTINNRSDILGKLEDTQQKQLHHHHHHNETILSERCKYLQDTLRTLQANHTEIIKRIPNTTTIIDALRDTLLQQP